MADGPSGALADHLDVGLGFLAGLAERDVSEGIPVEEGCRRSFVPVSTVTVVLDVCRFQGSSSRWVLYVPDAERTGYWGFVAVVGENRHVDGPTALAAVVEFADRAW